MKTETKQTENDAYAKFEALARKLVNVPKKDVDKSAKKVKQQCDKKERAKV